MKVRAVYSLLRMTKNNGIDAINIYTIILFPPDDMYPPCIPRNKAAIDLFVILSSLLFFSFLLIPISSQYNAVSLHDFRFSLSLHIHNLNHVLVKSSYLHHIYLYPKCGEILLSSYLYKEQSKDKSTILLISDLLHGLHSLPDG